MCLILMMLVDKVSQRRLRDSIARSTFLASQQPEHRKTIARLVPFLEFFAGPRKGGHKHVDANRLYSAARNNHSAVNCNWGQLSAHLVPTFLFPVLTVLTFCLDLFHLSRKQNVRAIAIAISVVERDCQGISWLYPHPYNASSSGCVYFRSWASS
jgi:hypothetical protein